MSSGGQILVIPFQGQGHVIPSTELCKRLSTALPYAITLVVPSHISSSIVPSPLFQVIGLSADTPDTDTPHFDPHHHDQNMSRPFTDLLSRLCNSPDPPICVIVDVMFDWPIEPCKNFSIPIVTFFTSAACSAAMMYALWKAGFDDLKPGETRTLPGLPQDMYVSLADMMPPPPGPHGPGVPDPVNEQKFTKGDGRGPPSVGFPMPPGPPETGGGRPRWLTHTEDSIAVMVNTCNDLEHLFIDYLAKEIGKPVWGVGPLLPEQYWKSDDTIVHDHDMRSKRETSISEDKVNKWLESKQLASVIFVAFGSEVSPTADELAELALALEESTRPFIWAIQNGAGRPGPPGGPMGFHGPPGGGGPMGFHGPPSGGGPMGFHRPPGSDDQKGFQLPEGIEKRIEGRGLIIRGWAPQLLILSHPSTGAFISHCGWNSTVEALARGIPLLAWPIRGDQFDNAKLVVNHLKVGLLLKVSQSDPIKKEDILQGIEKLMEDEESRKRASTIRSIFSHGFPASSMLSLYAFKDLIMQKSH